MGKTDTQRENIKLLLTLLEYIKGLEKKAHTKVFNMSNFQKFDITKLTREQIPYFAGNFATTQEEILSCGTTCCVSGWVAICPAFIKQGVTQSRIGAASYVKDSINGHHEACNTFVKLFGCTVRQANNLIFGYQWRKDLNLVTINDCIKYINTWH